MICSGSGSTKSLVNHAQKAREVGARIALITINPESPIAEMADVVVEISAPSPKSAKKDRSGPFSPWGLSLSRAKGCFWTARS